MVKNSIAPNATTKPSVINWVNVPRMPCVRDLNTVDASNLWRLNAMLLSSDALQIGR